MNCKKANEMNIARFLMSKGINPDKTVGNSFWYCSPLRNEKTPSFKVDLVKNLWHDFGTGTGGSLVDLVCKYYNVDVPGALLILFGASIETPILSFSDKQSLSHNQESRLVVKNVQPLQNYALIQYLNGRKINPGFACLYCREAHYNTPTSDRSYFSIAFENDRHGYELRNKYFKGSTSPKDITTIPGKNGFAVNVFEGFVDFLSALTYYNIQQPSCDTIVLNGVGFIQKIIDRLPRYARINLYLDNDNAGKEASDRIVEVRPDAVNRSQLMYPGNKDFNEFICSCRK